MKVFLKQPPNFKDEFYDLIAYASTLDEIKIKIMEIEENKKEKDQNKVDDNTII